MLAVAAVCYVSFVAPAQLGLLMLALPRSPVVVLMGLLAIGAALFTAYCQLHALAVGVDLPDKSAAIWGLIAGAPSGFLAFVAWYWRDQARSHLTAKAIVIAFILILTWGVMARGVIGPSRVPEPSELAKQLFAVLPFSLAMIGMALAHLSRKSDVIKAPGSWMEFPEEPLLRLRPEDVMWVSAAGNYCELHLADRTHLIRLPLATAAARLQAQGFARTHRSALVNLSALRAVEISGKRRKAVARLACGTALPIGARYRGDLLAAISAHSSL